MAIDMLGTVLRQIEQVFGDGPVTGLSDRQLLERFVTRREATTFEARLVGSLIIKGDKVATDSPLLVRLVAAGSIKGRLIDEDGLPWAGAGIGVVTFDSEGQNLPGGDSTANSDCLWPDGETVVTDSAGRFQLEGLKPGVDFALRIRSAGYRDTMYHLEKVIRTTGIEAGQTRELGDLKFTPSRD